MNVRVSKTEFSFHDSQFLVFNHFLILIRQQLDTDRFDL